MKIALNIFLVIAISGCTHELKPEHYSLDSQGGHYYSDRAFTRNYFTVYNDTAFAYFITVEKFPTSILYDTLTKDTSGLKMIGNQSILFQSDGKLYFRIFPIGHPSSAGKSYKIEKYEKFDEAEFNGLCNAAALNSLKKIYVTKHNNTYQSQLDFKSAKDKFGVQQKFNLGQKDFLKLLDSIKINLK